MNPPSVQLIALSCARRSALPLWRASRFPTVHRVSRHQSRCFESSAGRRDEVDSTAPSPKPYRTLGPVESNVYELVPLAGVLKATRYVNQINNAAVTRHFSRRKLNMLSTAVKAGGPAIEASINIFTHPYAIDRDTRALSRIILDLESALVADKVLSAMQDELRLSQGTFLSSEDRTKLEDFIKALIAALPLQVQNYRKKDHELIEIVASLRGKSEKPWKPNAGETRSEEERASIPQPTGSLSVSLYTSEQPAPTPQPTGSLSVSLYTS